MPIAYFDCPTGIAGDMCLGALVSAGVPLTYLADRLRSLGIADEYHLGAVSVQQQGQQATQVQVTLRHPLGPAAPPPVGGHDRPPSTMIPATAPSDTPSAAVGDASDHS
ncbi:nickel insertion protein, partial [Trichothermofontia sp.]